MSSVQDILVKHGLTGDALMWRDSVGPGWHDIVDRLCADLIALGWDKQINQVKEKFGGLRFYIGAQRVGEEAFAAICDRIDKAERESFKTCEDCGKPGRPRDGGWIRTLCDEHAAEKEKADEKREAEFLAWQRKRAAELERTGLKDEDD